jgi:hypothetical protein
MQTITTKYAGPTNTKAEAKATQDFAKAQGYTTSQVITLADSYLVIIYA